MLEIPGKISGCFLCCGCFPFFFFCCSLICQIPPTRGLLYLLSPLFEMLCPNSPLFTQLYLSSELNWSFPTDIVPIIYCCITNYPKCDLKNKHFSMVKNLDRAQWGWLVSGPRVWGLSLEGLNIWRWLEWLKTGIIWRRLNSHVWCLDGDGSNAGLSYRLEDQQVTLHMVWASLQHGIARAIGPLTW